MTNPTDTEKLLAGTTYRPFPDGTTPDGWPDEYVASSDYLAVCAKVRELQSERDAAISQRDGRSHWIDNVALPNMKQARAERDAALAQVARMRGLLAQCRAAFRSREREDAIKHSDPVTALSRDIDSAIAANQPAKGEG